MFKRRREKRQRELDDAYMRGYEAAKEEDLPLVEQALETGARLAYLECANALIEAAKQKSPDAIVEVCRQIAKNAGVP